MEIKELRLADRAWPLLATRDTVKATATETARAPVKDKDKVKVKATATETARAPVKDKDKVKVMATATITATVAVRALALLGRQPSKAAASTPAGSRRSLPWSRQACLP